AVMLTFAFTRILGDEWSGAAASALVYLSPAMLVFTPLPNAEAVSMALVAAMLLTFARGDGALFGICAGAAVAARPQLVVAALVLVLFLIAHRWGPKLLSLPLLAIAAAGAVMLARKRDSLALGVALFAAAHLAFCVVAADRSAGVQPLLPAVVGVALIVAAPLRLFAMPLALAYGIGALMYVEPIVGLRGTDAPAAAATAYA